MRSLLHLLNIIEMTQYLSDKIKVCSFVSILLVLYIHSDFHEIPNEVEKMSFNIILQNFVSGKIGRLAVPVFFMISGYLFFIKVKNIGDVFRNQKKRIRTLLVPYLIAALFLPFFYMLLALLPRASLYVNCTEFCFLKGNVWDVLYRLYVDSGSGSPYGFHLWFLRDLIAIVIVSPFLFYLRKIDKRGGSVCLLFILSLFEIPVVTSLFWFVVGSYFINRMEINNRLVVVAAISVYFLICIAEIIYPNSFSPHYLSLLIKIVGVWSFWNLYNVCIKKSFELKKHELLEKCCGFTFFVYLYHEPTLNVVRKLLVVILGCDEFGFAVSYLLSPWIFVFFAILIGILLKRYINPIYKVCVGGR